MASQKLTDRKVKASLAAGRYYDGSGSGLHLHVRESGSKAWVQRIRLNGKYVDMGLGSYPAISLSKARKIASDNKTLALEGKDPRLVNAKPKSIPTFSELADQVVANKITGLSNPKHRAQWVSTIDTYAKPILGHLSVDRIEVQHVLSVLQPIWMTKNETARRLRGRLAAIFDHAIALKLRPSPNPAAWEANLSVLLIGPSKNKDANNQPALQRDDAQRWWKKLSLRDGMGTKALQFLTLVASRSGEVRGMTWSEIHPLNGDKTKPIWIIPAERMKAKREHRTPLTSMMISILESIPRHPSTDLIFHSEKGRMLSDMTLSATMKRIHECEVKEGGMGFIDISSKRIAVPHGLRSTFRNWAAENGQDSDMAEIQLAHKIGDGAFRAYHRTDLLEKRRQMMVEWGDFLAGNA